MARGRYFSEFEVGQSFETGGRTVTEADVVLFAGLSGDYNPLHTDQSFAEKTPFGQRIAHGMLSASISTGLAQTLGIYEGTVIALVQQTFSFKAPVFFGDTIRLRQTVDAVRPSSKGGKGTVTFKSQVLKQDDTVVVDGEWIVLFRDAG